MKQFEFEWRRIIDIKPISYFETMEEGWVYHIILTNLEWYETAKVKKYKGKISIWNEGTISLNHKDTYWALLPPPPEYLRNDDGEEE